MDVEKMGQITDPEVQRLAIQLEHERAMAELEIRKLEAQNESKRLDLQLFNQSSEGQIIERKQRLLKRFQGLLNEFLDACQDARWKQSELDEFDDRCKDLRSKIEDYCKENHLDPETLLIYRNLNTLKQYIVDAYNEIGIFSSGYTFDLSEDEKSVFASLALTSFDALAEETEIQVEQED